MTQSDYPLVIPRDAAARLLRSFPEDKFLEALDPLSKTKDVRDLAKFVEGVARAVLAAPFGGTWRHAEGFVCCGSLRVFRVDFDTDPAPEVQKELLDWVCLTLNRAQP